MMSLFLRGRKILNELASGGAVTKSEGKGDVDIAESSISTMTMPTPIYQTSTGQYITVGPGGTIQLAGTEQLQGLQGISMTNPAAGGQQGTTILQYAHTADGQQILVPSNQVVVQTASGDMQTYQIRTSPATNSLPQTVMMASPMSLQPQSTKAEDVTLKREIRLMKNREAARECRRKKKEYLKCLENRVAVLENQNKTLIEELKTLKDIYCHKTG
ncbi:cyclic AMP-dependent transcription factor ATF-1-like [Scyliorhinus torazame]|uniref:cyclic AMP-dependent transcription factor ATF-1-like n=1 Tax=Scyliorhinus torazame TaxID=75743 RepID=UPI003B5C9D99